MIDTGKKALHLVNQERNLRDEIWGEQNQRSKEVQTDG